METLKYNLINNWNIIRLIRLGLSIIILVQAIHIHDVLFGIFGGFFMFQAFTNTGCCGVNSCAPISHKSTNDK